VSPAISRGPKSGLAGQVFQAAFIALTAGLLSWLVWLYGNALRDARYLDGWLLAAGMVVQVYFHVRLRQGPLSPRAAATWRQIHIFVGYVLIALFFSHSNFSLPDTSFEWALWAAFLLVALSGVLGTYLAWSVPAKLGPEDATVFERIPIRRAELAKQIHTLASKPDNGQLALALPAAPYEDWILDLYRTQLREFFQGPRNTAAHLFGSQRHLKRLTGEIDNLERYVGKSGQGKLNAMKALLLEKDRLDFARVHLGLTKLWLFIHVPVTYGLVILSVLHILVVYAFSSGVW
jgi:hypothetical protein